MIFQDPLSALHPYYTIGQQIVEAYRVHHNVDKKMARSRAVEMLDRVGIPQPDKRVDSYPHEFSGGMRQRAMIAMSLVNNPELLIADEPTTALDVTVQAQILDLIRDLQKEFGSAVIIITHDLGVVAETGRRHPGDVRRPLRRARSGREGLLRAAAPLHLGSARLDAAHRPRDQPTGSSRSRAPPPSLINIPSGCAFNPRCPYADVPKGDVTRTVRPELPAGRQRALLRLPHVAGGPDADLDRRDCAEAVSETSEGRRQ